MERRAGAIFSSSLRAAITTVTGGARPGSRGGISPSMRMWRIPSPASRVLASQRKAVTAASEKRGESYIRGNVPQEHDPCKGRVGLRRPPAGGEHLYFYRVMSNQYEVEVVFRQRAVYRVEAADRQSAERLASERWREGAPSAAPGFEWSELESVRAVEASEPQRKEQDAELVLRFLKERERLILKLGGD